MFIFVGGTYSKSFYWI